MSRPFVVHETFETPEEAFECLRRLRRTQPRSDFDMVEVHSSMIGIRSANPWAVVRYVRQGRSSRWHRGR